MNLSCGYLVLRVVAGCGGLCRLLADDFFICVLVCELGVFT